MNRTGNRERKTSETDIDVSIDLDSVKPSVIESGVPFFDHMLNAMSRHGRFFLDLNCSGDLEIDDHHSVEDIGLVMGDAVAQALGDCSGIFRFGQATVPMDDALAMASVDISGRPWFSYRGDTLAGKVGAFSEELTIEFFRAFTQKAGITLHLHLLDGDNRHHIQESLYKAVGVALFRAWSIDEKNQGVPVSTKGTIL